MDKPVKPGESRPRPPERPPERPSPKARSLAELKKGERGVVERIEGDSAFKRKLGALGVVRGVEIMLDHTAPMGDPRAYFLLGYNLSLRNEDARKILLEPE